MVFGGWTLPASNTWTWMSLCWGPALLALHSPPPSALWLCPLTLPGPGAHVSLPAPLTALLLPERSLSLHVLHCVLASWLLRWPHSYPKAPWGHAWGDVRAPSCRGHHPASFSLEGCGWPVLTKALLSLLTGHKRRLPACDWFWPMKHRRWDPRIFQFEALQSLSEFSRSFFS